MSGYEIKCRNCSNEGMLEEFLDDMENEKSLDLMKLFEDGTDFLRCPACGETEALDKL